MIYPKLENTPIKEIIFSISYEEIVDKECFDNFIKLDFIKNKFKEINPYLTKSIEISNIEAKIIDNYNGFHLKSNNEILQMRSGSLSYHFLNGYCGYDDMLMNFVEFWEAFDEVTKDSLTITSISVRYINVIEVDDDNSASRLIQLYPKQSSDRNIISFQNAVNFTYNELPEFEINVVSTQKNEKTLLLDINVNSRMAKGKLAKNELKKLFEPLQEIKNKVFFDSITAKALIRYINQNN